MSKPRNIGDKVWLKPCSGFVGESDKYLCEIQPQDMPLDHCMICNDPTCSEWDTLWTVNAPQAQFALYHVSECQMLDEPYENS